MFIVKLFPKSFFNSPSASYPYTLVIMLKDQFELRSFLLILEDSKEITGYIVYNNEMDVIPHYVDDRESVVFKKRYNNESEIWENIITDTIRIG